MAGEQMDCRNWDEDVYRESILEERETFTRTIFRTAFAPNPNPNPNSDFIVTASSDGSIASYSISACLAMGCGSARGQNWLTSEPNFFTQGHDGPAYDVKFYGEGDDSLLLSCGDDGRIRGWNWKEIIGSDVSMQEGKLKPLFDLVNPQHKGPWGALSPIPENNAIAVNYQTGSIYAAAGDSCAYCWDVIITGSEDGSARIWDCKSGKCIQVIDPDMDKKLNTSFPSIRCIALDASESWLACGKGRSLSLWNLPARECVMRTTTHTSIQDVLFDDNQILTVGAEPLLTRFNMNGDVISQIPCAPQSVFSISLHPSGVTAVSGYGGLVDMISQFGSHSCTFRCKGNRLFSSSPFVMAILESPELFDTTSSGTETATLRRRPSVRAVSSAEPLLDSDSTSVEAESVVEDSASDQSATDSIGNICGIVNQEQLAESPIENEEKVKENGENSNHSKGAEAVKFTYRPSAPAHRRNKESPLSSDNIFKQSHAGLFNLCIVVLIAVNSRLIIENLMKYGWLIKSGFWFGPKSLRDWPLFMCCLSLPIFPVAAFLIEKSLQQKYISNSILTVGAEPLLTRFNMNGDVISQIPCAPQSVFSISMHPSGVTAVSGYGGLVDMISQFGSHSCTFRCKGNHLFSSSLFVMAILESPELFDTTSSGTETATLRRRLSVRAVSSAEPLLDSDSTSVEAESVVEDSASDQSATDSIGNICGIVNQEQLAESPIENEEKVKENGENSNHSKGAEAVKFTYRPSAPAHRSYKESPLSSDNIFKQSHAGLFNLCIVVLIAVNSRLIIENLMKYGWLIKSGFWFGPKSLRDWPLFMCCLSLPIFPVAAFLIEKSLQQKYISNSVAVFLHVIVTTTSILYPVLVILRCDSAVQSGVTLMLFACIVWLKLVSYAHTNYDLRDLAKSLDKRETLSSYWNMDYSYDVSFKSLAYFMVAPTLCYQPSYPRTACIRKGWVVRQLIKLIIFTGFMGFIVEQYINPIVQNSEHPLKANLLYATERVLKLSVPNLYVWLCMFYCFFHLWLNILAELLRFGDREFYKDWWNARTVAEVDYLCAENRVAILIAFLVSAIFHELCIAIPFHIFKFWACIGIMFQVPLVIMTNYLQDKFNNSMVGFLTSYINFFHLHES
ncbi:hypothetical protein RD792_010870 [Penstemon davidsonii]|uniref:diacylglycerol O-acyltransferase n=1 Tax=Penstemon davidsonii TaxID=160366 RepID=A0ABR0D2Z9_9LAMI|nr:hypothetical protein RD792_010870 [Penstemon davidsonii]